MQKLLTSLAATAALALFVSTAQAECAFHNKHVTASNATAEEGVAMSTHDEPMLPIVTEEAPTTAATAECPADAKDCVPAKE